MTLTFLRQHFKNVSVEHSAAWGSFLFFATVSFILFILALNGLISKSFVDIVKENRSPKTLELFSSVSLLFLFGRIAFYGVVGEVDSKPFRVLGVWLPNFLLGVGGALMGTFWGAALAVAATNSKLPTGVGWANIMVDGMTYVGLLILAYLIFALTLISPHTAPGYKTKEFQVNLRFGSSLMFFLILGRTMLLLYAWQHGVGVF